MKSYGFKLPKILCSDKRNLMSETFKQIGSMTSCYLQIGNAVPVGLGEALGTHILNLIQNNEIADKVGFRYSRYKRTSHEDLA